MESERSWKVIATKITKKAVWVQFGYTSFKTT